MDEIPLVRYDYAIQKMHLVSNDEKSFNFKKDDQGKETSERILDKTELALAKGTYKEEKERLENRIKRDSDNDQFLRVKYPASAWKTKRTITEFNSGLEKILAAMTLKEGFIPALTPTNTSQRPKTAPPKNSSKKKSGKSRPQSAKSPPNPPKKTSPDPAKKTAGKKAKK